MSMRILGVSRVRHFSNHGLLYALIFLFELKNGSFIVVPRSPQTLNLCSKCYKAGKQLHFNSSYVVIILRKTSDIFPA